ncbi:MAG: DUF2059 domain-containing protein [Candidatus Endonucleobacter bathymodioli]|uniref:DUF2059 domain-containing protein n=1 Tax=Candidatus Endonucleibacter bathymodioli TaxID=539814 RepID=A0AA90NJT9_9GAMM|nr:DUF2059 domain-containing protein [Candidatus Endonucleobacter bathymodioli]
MKGKQGLSVGLAAVLMITALQVYAVGSKMVLLGELYEAAEVERQLQWIRASMELNAADYTLSKEVLDVFNQMVNVRYSIGFFKTSMMTTLDESLTDAELLELVEWYKSPLGEKIQRMESASNNPFNASRVQTYIDERLSKELPRSSRTDLIDDLMKVLDVVEHGSDLAASASFAGLRMLKEVVPRLNGNSLPPSQGIMAREKSIIIRTMAGRMKGILFYTYRSLSDQEIRSYIKFSRRASMQNFQRGQVQAMLKIL